MHSKMRLLALCAVPLLLTACGGGDNTNPYDGTWQAVYPPLNKDSTITDTKTVLCDNPGGALVIKDSKGTTTLSAQCTTTIITSSTDPTTGAVTTTPSLPYTVITNADISVSIEAKKAVDQKDVLNATVNGVTFTGQCISTISCSATSAAGDTLGLTR
jgi:hypothetical protein